MNAQKHEVTERVCVVLIRVGLVVSSVLYRRSVISLLGRVSD